MLEHRMDGASTEQKRFGDLDLLKLWSPEAVARYREILSLYVTEEDAACTFYLNIRLLLSLYDNLRMTSAGTERFAALRRYFGLIREATGLALADLSMTSDQRDTWLRWMGGGPNQPPQILLTPDEGAPPTSDSRYAATRMLRNLDAAAAGKPLPYP